MPMVKINTVGDWDKAARILGAAPRRIRLALDRAVLQEAQFFRKKVVEGFRTQSPAGKDFKPLAATTLAIRRFQGFKGTKALLRSGDLKNSVKVVKRVTPLGAEAFIGVLRTARSKKGAPLVNIARVHEFGAGPIVIQVTPAMRKFLAAAFRQELGGFGGGRGGVARGIIIVRIPARPFIGPVADEFFSGPKAAARFQARVAANLSGMFGAFGPGGTSTAAAASRAQRLAEATRGPPTREPGSGRFQARPPARLGFRFFR